MDVRIHRTTSRMRDFLAPARGQADLVRYLWAYCATITSQVPVALMTTTNELDVMVTDTCGERAEYTQRCHGLIARMRNKQLGRDDHFWNRACPDETVMLDCEHTIDELARFYCLPLERGLVADVSHWNGAMLLPDKWGDAIEFQRPAIFGSRTLLPEVLVVQAMPPACLLEAFGLDESKRLVNHAIAERTDLLDSQRRGRVLGRRGCDRLDPRGRRGSPKPPPRRPDFAGAADHVRAAEAELRMKRAFYASCLQIFRDHGDPANKAVAFAAGTVMMRKLGCYCDALPPSAISHPAFVHYDTLPPPGGMPHTGEPLRPGDTIRWTPPSSD